MSVCFLFFIILYKISLSFSFINMPKLISSFSSYISEKLNLKQVGAKVAFPCKKAKKRRFRTVVELRNHKALKMKKWDAKYIHDPKYNAGYAQKIHELNLKNERERFNDTYMNNYDKMDSLISQSNRIILVNFLQGVFK